MSENDTPHNDANVPMTVDEQIHDTPIRTPLPKFQLFIIALIQFAEPITAIVIYPFVNQFVRDTGVTRGDEKKTGYYAGTIESAFFFSEALTVFHWGRLSDRLGRRPILLLGPVGLAFAMLGFGLSTTFWPLVVYRCMQGVFNGNIGVSKSVMAEITDDTNIGDAFAMMPLMWSFGSTIAPVIGGVLSSPAKRWPNTFGKLSIFRDHPYFLPCAVASAIAICTFLISCVGLKESLPAAITRRKIKEQEKLLSRASSVDQSSSTHLLSHQDELGNYGAAASMVNPENSITAVHQNSPSVAIRDLFTRHVMLTLTSYLLLVFTDMSYVALLPLMYSTPIPLGGLGLTPYQIGTIMGSWGLFNAIVQFNSLGRIIRRFGPRKTYIASNAGLFICLGTYPVSAYFARQAGRVDWKVCCVMGVQLFFQMLIYIAYGSMNILIVLAAPTKSSLGATNGLAQMLGCVARSLAPTVASSLFSISLEHHLLGGNMVYFILQAIAALGIFASFKLPKISHVTKN